MSGRAPDRFLTSVLMTDMVGSTELAAELGDRGWRELVQLHNKLVRDALRRHGGREMDTAGDGFFAIFDAPASAILCALEIILGVQDITQLTRLYFSGNFLYMQSLTMLAFMYLVMVVILTRLVRLVESRLQRAYAR